MWYRHVTFVPERDEKTRNHEEHDNGSTTASCRRLLF